MRRLGTASGNAQPYAMNMRAAEAIVSNAPTAMKIFPISEVWSQVVLSLAKTGAADAVALTAAAAIATVCGCGDGGVCACVGGALLWLSLSSSRSTSLS